MPSGPVTGYLQEQAEPQLPTWDNVPSITAGQQRHLQPSDITLHTCFITESMRNKTAPAPSQSSPKHLHIAISMAGIEGRYDPTQRTQALHQNTLFPLFFLWYEVSPARCPRFWPQSPMVTQGDKVTARSSTQHRAAAPQATPLFGSCTRVT